ncbi:MAG TPA: hypothetical protein VNM90_04300 [Haliangium sp.]|nr:hypothetical protein [Haliangium sp.]
MSVPIEHHFFHDPHKNPPTVMKHLRIKDKEAVISTDDKFFTKGIALKYNASYPQDGTIVTFKTDVDDHITSVTSTQVTFTQNGTEWSATISADDIQNAVNSGNDYIIDFNVTWSGGSHDPQILVTPF